MKTRISKRKPGVSNQEPEIAEKERLRSSLHLKEVAEESVVLAPEADDHTSQITPPDAPAALETKTYPESPPELGERYEILDYIGAGGMGTVWKVLDKTLDETFAIKVLRPQFATDEDSIKRIKQEARLAMDLTHANIAAVFGATEDVHGQPCIIMRYAEGESLQNILAKEGKLDPVRAEQIYNQIADALVHSHMKGIVHRDIKPSNIIISRTASGGEVVKLVDFGIAKSVYEEVSKTLALTKTSDVVGSPRYMSPEQFLGQEVGPPADWYSLGCVYYEMLAGHPPFTEENPVRLILQHLHDFPDYSRVPKNRVFEISALLQKDPKQRKWISPSIKRNAWIPHGITLSGLSETGPNAILGMSAFFFFGSLTAAVQQLAVLNDFAFAASLLFGILVILTTVVFALRKLSGFGAPSSILTKLFETTNIMFTASALFAASIMLLGPIPFIDLNLHMAFSMLPPCILSIIIISDSKRRAISNFVDYFKIPFTIFGSVILLCISYSSPDVHGYDFPTNFRDKLPTRQAALEYFSSLPHTRQDDLARMFVLTRMGDTRYSLATYRQVCNQVIANNSYQDPSMKIDSLLALASTYSGKTEESNKTWEIEIVKAIQELENWIKQPEQWRPYVVSSQIKKTQMEKSLSISEECLRHGRIDLAKYNDWNTNNFVQYMSMDQRERERLIHHSIYGSNFRLTD